MNEARRDRLRTLLREGDPAAADPGPPAEEIARLRRSVLAAAASQPARAWHATALRWAAAAGVAACLGLAWLTLGERGDPSTLERSARTGAPADRSAERAPGTPPRRRPLELDSAPVAPSERSAEVVAGARATRPSGPAVGRSPARAERPAADARPGAGGEHPDATPADAAVVASTAEKPGLQLRVTAPGGTRIVWVLTPPAGP